MSNFGGWFFVASSNGDTFTDATTNDLLIYTDSASQNIMIGSVGNANLEINNNQISSYRPLVIQSNTTISSTKISTSSFAPYQVNNFMVAHTPSANKLFIGFSNSSMSNNFAIAQTLSNETYINSGNNNPLHFSIGGTEVMTLNPGGDLDLSGVVTQTSDRNLKTDIKPVTDALQKLLQISGYTYRMRNRPTVYDESAGLIAQEVQRVLPQAVKMSSATQALTLDYAAVSCLYVEAIKELHTMITDLQQKLNQ